MEFKSRPPFLTFSLDDRHLRGPASSDLKQLPLPPVESDTDSIADYADGENTGKKEDVALLIID